MQVIETKVYTFAELSDTAKEKAREWWRNADIHYDWFENMYDDAKEIGLTIKEFDTSPMYAKGEFIKDAEEVAKKIIENHGKDCETHKTAKSFLAELQKLGDQPDTDSEKSEAWEDKKISLEEEFLKDLLHDYAILLRNEYEYLNSDEYIDESITINEYTFTEDGKRFG